MMQNRACEEGQYTQAVYGSIKEGRYDEAVRILEFERQNFPRSRAALSVLAFCYYHMQDFKNCAATYEDLIRVCPDVDDYKLYYAQALFKAAMYRRRCARRSASTRRSTSRRSCSCRPRSSTSRTS